jgi:hypothetical protein
MTVSQRKARIVSRHRAFRGATMTMRTANVRLFAVSDPSVQPS